jgi:hypothetical protein
MTSIGGWGSWGGSGESPNQNPNNIFGNQPQQPNTPTDTGGAFPSGQNSPGNFGQQMFPWLQPYGGGFTAPMSPYEQNALGGYSNFVQGGMGLNNAGNYLNNELGGQYLNLSSNPYLQQIQQGEQGIKDYNDQQALSRIGSSMALGGNALSGAKLGATSDYMRNSNNAFESLMGQLMNQNYGMERGLQSQAPNQLANLANTASGGYSQLFGMGALPRSLQQNDLNAQYQDFLRQTGGMQNAYNSPDQQILQMLYGGGYHGQYQPQYGSSTLDQIAGLLGGSNIDWGSILGSLGGLFGGSGGTDTQGAATATDGQVIGYDATPGTTGPANYYDKNWYLNALTNAEAQQAQSAAAAKNGPNTTVPAILTLLLSMLGKSGGSNKSKSGIGLGGPGGGGPGGKSAGSSDPGYTTSGGRTYGNDKSYWNASNQNPADQMGGANDPFADPFNTPGSPYYQDPLYGGGYGPEGPGQSVADFINNLPPIDSNGLAGGYGGDLYGPFGNSPSDFGGGGGDGGASDVQFDGYMRY